MSNKCNNNEVSAAFAMFVTIGGLILSFLNFLADNIFIILIILIGLLVIVGISLVISKAVQEKEQAEVEKQKNLAIVDRAETHPSLISIPTSKSFANKEEEHVNTLFRIFLKRNNDVVLAQSHVDYIQTKVAALRNLNRTEEATQLETEIIQAQLELSFAQAQRSKSFESEYNNYLLKSSDIRNVFTSFTSKLTTQQSTLIDDFFQGPFIQAVGIDDSSALIFTPSYVMCYFGTSQTIRLIQYKDVSLYTRITTEIRNDHIQPNDEIEHIGFLHETKDGFRDMRYSWKNNPSYTYVYRGIATIQCGGLSYEHRFSNKSLTEEFEKSFKAYLSLIEEKYKSAIQPILDHDDKFAAIGNIETFITEHTAESTN